MYWIQTQYNSFLGLLILLRKGRSLGFFLIWRKGKERKKGRSKGIGTNIQPEDVDLSLIPSLGIFQHLYKMLPPALWSSFPLHTPLKGHCWLPLPFIANPLCSVCLFTSKSSHILRKMFSSYVLNSFPWLFVQFLCVSVATPSKILKLIPWLIPDQKGKNPTEPNKQQPTKKPQNKHHITFLIEAPTFVSPSVINRPPNPLQGFFFLSCV